MIMADYYHTITKHQEKILSTFHMWTHLILTMSEEVDSQIISSL